MIAKTRGLSYKQMARLQPGDLVRVRMGNDWRKGVFLGHTKDHMTKIRLAYWRSRTGQRVLFIPNGLQFTQSFFEEIEAGEHMQLYTKKGERVHD